MMVLVMAGSTVKDTSAMPRSRASALLGRTVKPESMVIVVALADARFHQAEQIIKMRERINKLIADETGQTLERVAKDTDRDYWMTVEEAIEYGIVGKKITSMAELG